MGTFHRNLSHHPWWRPRDFAMLACLFVVPVAGSLWVLVFLLLCVLLYVVVCFVVCCCVFCCVLLYVVMCCYMSVFVVVFVLLCVCLECLQTYWHSTKL